MVAIMTLDEFLRREALTEGAFAALIGTTQATVNRYRRGVRVPPRPVMRRIAEATAGCVQPNDFHDPNVAPAVAPVEGKEPIPNPGGEG